MDDASITLPFEPANAVDILNQLERGIVGSEKPKVIVIKEPDDYEEPDNDPGSPEQAWA